MPITTPEISDLPSNYQFERMVRTKATILSLELIVTDVSIIIQGQVPTYHAKQMAQVVLSEVKSCDRFIDNQIQVIP